MIDRLAKALYDEDSLHKFLSSNSNSIELQDYFNQPFSALRECESELEEIIIPNYDVISTLDLDQENHAAFILHPFRICRKIWAC